jgi:hypothetical protein
MRVDMVCDVGYMGRWDGKREQVEVQKSAIKIQK